MKHTVFVLAILLGLLYSAPARAQGTPYDCFFVYSFTGATSQTGQSNASAAAPCVAWRVTYTTTGFSSVTVKFQTSPDNSSYSDVTNSICSSSVQPPCVTDGASPLAAGVMGSSSFRAYAKYVRVNVSSVTGSGSGQVVVYGYRGTSASAATGGGSGGATTAGVAFIDAALGNGATDATAAIQAALDTATIGTVMIPSGDYLFSGITIPEGKLLECVGSGSLVTVSYLGTHTPVSQLIYTGSGIAITGSWSSGGGRMTVSNCNITKQGSVGGTAIQSHVSVGSLFKNNQIFGFTTAILLYGDDGGVYFDEIRSNGMWNNTNGITSSNVGPNTVNSVTVADNTIHGSNISILACGFCSGWKISRNDIERPTGSGGFGIRLVPGGGSYSNLIEQNWIECNGCTATTFTAIWSQGAHVLLNNILGTQESGDWTNIVTNSYVINPYNRDSAGNTVPFVYLPVLQLTYGTVAELATLFPGEGMVRGVTNALNPINGSTVVAGGSVHVLVFYNGTNWIVASGGTVGISASGTSCTITAITNGVITGASCV